MEIDGRHEWLELFSLLCMFYPICHDPPADFNVLSQVKNPRETFNHEQYLFNAGETNGKQFLGLG